jgi:hypothetical protein
MPRSGILKRVAVPGSGLLKRIAVPRSRILKRIAVPRSRILQRIAVPRIGILDCLAVPRNVHHDGVPWSLDPVFSSCDTAAEVADAVLVDTDQELWQANVISPSADSLSGDDDELPAVTDFLPADVRPATPKAALDALSAP